MRKIYLFFLIVIFAETALAQTSKYFHDTAGSRNKRQFEPTLPVTLIAFSATRQEHAALLNWNTSFETNSNRFEIERSGGRTKWAVIGTVDAAGERLSETTYSFLDAVPLPRENLYRLRMVDNDETFAYSRIRSVFFDTETAVFPNPVCERLKVTAENVKVVQLHNTSGQVVLETSAVPAGGIDIGKLATGIYLVRIELSDGATTVTKIVKE